ncbi:MAG: GumC family protein [Bacteroidota bacterium]
MDNKTNAQSAVILNIIRVFLHHWLLLGISVFFFLVLGMVYMRYSSRTYSVFARISLDTEQVNRARGADTYVNVSDLMNQEKDFRSKIAFLRSTPLIREVITDMNLFTTYYIQEEGIPKELPFSFINIYKNAPFLVIVDEKSPQPINTLFYLKVIDDERFMINSFEPQAPIYHFDEQENSGNELAFFYLDGTFFFGDTIKNNYCSFKVLLNSNYNSEEYQGKDLFFRFNNPTYMAYGFQESLTIASAFYESTIADLTFETDNLQLAKDFLSNLIEKYIEKNLEKKNYDANNTIDYIDQQLANISGSLGQSEMQLQNFKSSRDVMNINEKTSNITGQISSLEYSRDEIQTRLMNLTRLNEYFESHKDSSTFIAPSYMGMSDATLATLIQELTTLSTERQNLISTNQLLNPRIKTLDANIATIKKVISDNISFNLTTTQTELNEAKRKIADLEKEYAKLPQTQRQLMGLERQFNINDAVYTSLLERRIQAEIIKASNVSDCEIVEPVRYVEISSPNIKKVGLIAIFLGLFFPGIYIILTNFLTSKVKTVDEIKRLSRLPNIGSIVHNDSNFSNVIFNHSQSQITETFHKLKSSIVYYLLGEKHRNILVTSSMPNEGKSFCALNLAASFASTHSKTVLIEFDLRKNSQVFKELKDKEFTGLSSFLIKQATLEEITVKTENPNLDIILNKDIPPDPVALISTDRTRELFELLKKNYDYIIVDSPPYSLVADTFLLMTHMDLTIFVSRLGVVKKKPLKQTLEDLESKNLSRVYHLFNDVAKIDKPYSEKYSYGVTKKRRFGSRKKGGKKKKS